MRSAYTISNVTRSESETVDASQHASGQSSTVEIGRHTLMKAYLRNVEGMHPWPGNVQCCARRGECWRVTGELPAASVERRTD